MALLVRIHASPAVVFVGRALSSTKSGTGEGSIRIAGSIARRFGESKITALATVQLPRKKPIWTIVSTLSLSK